MFLMFLFISNLVGHWMIVPSGNDNHIQDDIRIQDELYHYDSVKVIGRSFYMDFGDGLLAYGKCLRFFSMVTLKEREN